MIPVKYRIWAILVYLLILNSSPLPRSWPTEFAALTALLFISWEKENGIKANKRTTKLTLQNSLLQTCCTMQMHGWTPGVLLGTTWLPNSTHHIPHATASCPAQYSGTGHTYIHYAHIPHATWGAHYCLTFSQLYTEPLPYLFGVIPTVCSGGENFLRWRYQARGWFPWWIHTMR